jgi:hypothetical protein
VCGTCLIMAASFSLLFYRDATPFPFAEDWDTVPVMTGHEPSFLKWLWSQNDVHRIPLPRLITVGLLALSKGNFALIGAFNAALLVAGAAALIAYARRARGGSTHYADAIFPLLLLNWSHSCQVLFPFLLSLIIPVLATLCLGCILAAPAWLARLPVACAAAAALLSLPLCGFVGLLYLPGFTVALVWGIRSLWTGGNGFPRARDAARLLTCSLVITLTISGLYFVGFEFPENPPSPGQRASLSAALRVLSLGLGAASEWAWKPAVLGWLTLAGASAMCLGLALLRRREGLERIQAWGLAIFAANAVGFGFSIGWARAGWEAGFGIPTRYALLVVPAMIAFVLAWEHLAAPKARQWMLGGLTAVLVLLVPINTRAGDYWFADWYRQGMNSFRQDLDGGMPFKALAKKHQPFLIHWLPPETVEDYLIWQRETGVVAFVVTPKPAFPR